MRPNPYAIAARRYFLIALGVTGSLLFAWFALYSILAQSAPGMFRHELLFGVTYDAATSSSQFWFYVVLYTALSAICAAVAWRSYRA